MYSQFIAMPIKNFTGFIRQIFVCLGDKSSPLQCGLLPQDLGRIAIKTAKRQIDCPKWNRQNEKSNDASIFLCFETLN
jgi:hypothetical protein